MLGRAAASAVSAMTCAQGVEAAVGHLSSTVDTTHPMLVQALRLVRN